jgi:hypothetical protein
LEEKVYLPPSTSSATVLRRMCVVFISLSAAQRL